MKGTSATEAVHILVEYIECTQAEAQSSDVVVDDVVVVVVVVIGIARCELRQYVEENSGLAHSAPPKSPP